MTDTPDANNETPLRSADSDREQRAKPKTASALRSVEPPEEIGGPEGPNPTRFGDWERKGRCIDF